MDSFEYNKIAAAILIALLTIKGADLIAEALIHPKMLKENVFKIEGVTVASSAEGGTQVEKKGPAPIEPLLATASAEKGAEVFKKCTSCHTIEAGGPNRIGPNLHNIVGATKAKKSGYSYSQAMEQKGGTWTYDDLNVYLFMPRNFVPGTKMSFAGIKDDKARADLIAYLRQETENPPPLPPAQTVPESKEPPKPSEENKSSSTANTKSAPEKKSTTTSEASKPTSSGTEQTGLPQPTKPVPAEPSAPASKQIPAAPETKPGSPTGPASPAAPSAPAAQSPKPEANPVPATPAAPTPSLTPEKQIKKQ